MHVFSLVAFFHGSNDLLLAAAFVAASPLRMLDPDEAIFPGFIDRLLHFAARSVPLRLHRVGEGRPVISLTFDDFPASAHEIAAPMLESFGVRASFFAATGLLGKPHPLWKMASPDAVSDLAERGHELGLHTHHHAPLWQMDSRTLRCEIEANLNRLQMLCPTQRIESFAYPYGVVTPLGKWKLSGMMRANRSAHAGINTGWVDLDFVRAIELSDSRISTEQVTDILDAVVASRGWAVFFAHAMSSSPKAFETSTGLLAHTVKAALERDIAIRPFTAALDEIGVPQRSGSTHGNA